MVHDDSNDEQNSKQLNVIIAACCLQWYSDQESHSVVNGQIGKCPKVDYAKIVAKIQC
jgi:hypothetical protein